MRPWVQHPVMGKKKKTKKERKHSEKKTKKLKISQQA
jgi:hypothetical protein